MKSKTCLVCKMESDNKRDFARVSTYLRVKDGFNVNTNKRRMSPIVNLYFCHDCVSKRPNAVHKIVEKAR